jgi:hypothetical protein
MNFMKAALCVFLKYLFQPLRNYHVSTLQHIQMFLKNSQRPDHILWNTKFQMSTYKLIICHQTESSVKFTFLEDALYKWCVYLRRSLSRKFCGLVLSSLLVPYKFSWN